MNAAAVVEPGRSGPDPARPVTPGPAPGITRAGPAPGPGAWQGWVAAAAVVVLLFLALGFLSDAFTPAPQGPAESSLATSSDGVAAWAALLARFHHPVVALRTPLTAARLPPQVTVVVLGAAELAPAAARNLRAFVTAGGRLVIGGGDPSATIGRLVSPWPRLRGAGARSWRPVGQAPEVAGVHSVAAAGQDSWSSAAAAVVALTGDHGPTVLVRTLGQGRIVMAADVSPLENRLLASADNARLALNLAGGPGRPVVFAEALHGYLPATGLAAIPAVWWVAFGGLLLAAGAWALGRGRRLGPPELPAPPPAPARGAYVDAVAAKLLRPRDRNELAGLLRTAVRRELDSARRPGDSGDPLSASSLGRLGLEDDEIAALAGDAGDESQLLALGRALSRVRSRR